MAAALIVGGDSMLGHVLSYKFRQEGMITLETTGRLDDYSRLYFDLSGSSLPDLGDVNVSVVFLCAGVTRLASCEADPPGSRMQNVEQTLRLAAHFVDR